MKPLKICHISTVHPCFDDRIFYKECVSLSSRFEVSLIVQSDKNKSVKNVNIISLPPFSNRVMRLLKGNFLAFKKAISAKAKVYHLHDPELIALGVLLKIFGKKVIFDMHELVYHTFEDKEWIRFKYLMKIAKYFYLFFEKIAFNLFDSLIIVVPSYFVHIKKHHAKHIDKVEIIYNYPLVKLIDSQIDNRLITSDNKIRLIYMGALSRYRGIKELIQSLANVNHDIELILLGNWDSETYKTECEKLDTWNKVNYLGFVKLDKIYGHLQQADIAVSMLYPIKNYLTSLPVKVFEYMAMKKPIIMSDFDYWKDTFGEAALYTTPYNPKEIAEKINTLIEDKELRTKLGENGRRLVDEKYSWEREEIKLIKIYHKILNIQD